MDKYKSILHTNAADINLYQCGIQFCGPSHANHAERPYYLLHFILEGKGVFACGGEPEQPLSKGNAFLICPGQAGYYRADAIAPWTYAWVAFDGIKAEPFLRQAGLTKKHPVYTAADCDAVGNALLNMVNHTRESASSQLGLLGRFYLFLDALVRYGTMQRQTDPPQREGYLQKLVSYIHLHIWERITVTELAAYAGLDRTYLYRIFKDALGCAPQEFILRTKLARAADLLLETEMPIFQIAHLVGYDDQLAFSRLFKKRYGCAPRVYRANRNAET